MRASSPVAGDRTTAWLLFAAALLLYARTISFQYALDDRAVTFENRFVREGVAGVPEILSTFYWAGFWDSNAGLFRPLSLVLLAVEWQIAPDAPRLYHAVNVLLYAFTAMVLYRVLRRLRDKPDIAIIATILWIVHPVHTEVVANIKSADEILVVLFVLLSLRSIVLRRFAIAGGLFFCALLSKETAIGWLPLLAVALVALWRREAIRAALPFGAAIGVWAVWHYVVIAGAPSPPITYRYVDNSLVAASGYASRIATAIQIQGRYLLKSFVGYPMSYDYSFRQIPNISFADPTVWISLLVLAGLVLYAASSFVRQPLPALGIAAWLLPLAPTSNLVVLIGATMGDRFLFGPTIGWALCVAVLIARMPRREDVALITGVLAIVYSLQTFTRAADWRSDETLFSADVARAPDSGRVRRNYGTLLMNRAIATPAGPSRSRMLDIAGEQFHRAIEIDPADYEARFALGQVEYQRGEYRASEQWTSSSIDVWHRLGAEPPAVAFLNRGDARMMLGDYAHALEDFEVAARMEPSNGRFAMKIGNALFGRGDLRGAAAAFEKAVKLDPESIEAWDKVANVQGMLGNAERSQEAFAEAARLRR